MADAVEGPSGVVGEFERIVIASVGTQARREIGKHADESFRRELVGAFDTFCGKEIHVWSFVPLAIGISIHSPLRGDRATVLAAIRKFAGRSGRLLFMPPASAGGAPRPAGAEIHLARDGGVAARSPPVLDPLRLGPGLEDQRRGRIHDPRHDEHSIVGSHNLTFWFNTRATGGCQALALYRVLTRRGIPVYLPALPSHQEVMK